MILKQRNDSLDSILCSVGSSDSIRTDTASLAKMEKVEIRNKPSLRDPGFVGTHTATDPYKAFLSNGPCSGLCRVVRDNARASLFVSVQWTRVCALWSFIIVLLLIVCVGKLIKDGAARIWAFPNA